MGNPTSISWFLSYVILLEQSLTSTIEGRLPKTLSKSLDVSHVGGPHLAVWP